MFSNKCLQCVTSYTNSKAIKMRNHIVYNTVIFVVRGLIPHSSKNCVSFKAHQISCLNTSFSCSMQIIAKQVFAPPFVNAYLNAARLMIVIELVCLNFYNCLWFIISLISLWCWQSNFRGKLKCFFTKLAARTAAGNAGCPFCSSLPGGKRHARTPPPRPSPGKLM